MMFYDTNQALKFGEFEYVLYNRNFYQYGDYPRNVMKITDSKGEYVYLSSCDYDLLNFESKSVLYQSRNIFLGSIKNSQYYPFDLILPEVESINITDLSRLDADAMIYYKEKGASINLIKTPVDIWDTHSIISSEVFISSLFCFNNSNIAKNTKKHIDQPNSMPEKIMNASKTTSINNNCFIYSFLHKPVPKCRHCLDVCLRQ